MCGLTGFLLLERQAARPELCDRLRRMIRVLHHRGPDDEDVWTDGRVGLAHSRLSIIDLSRAARQPMSDPDGRVVVVFNGEIYNFRDLRHQLEAHGHVFRTNSDTEVIIRSYLTWGINMVDRLSGMFAIALWDTVDQTLYLIRDRVGKKPMYYGWFDGVLLFGSEMKALLTWPGVVRNPNLQAINHFLCLQYVPTPYTAFTGFSKVPAAHFLSVTTNGRSHPTRYWALPPPDYTPPQSDARYCDVLAKLLDDSVRLRMIADVPIGAFLSGGVDSSAVVAFMARASPSPIKTFTVGFDETPYDERRYARLVAARYGTEHHEYVLKPSALELIPSLTWHYGEPYADSSAIATYYISALASRHVSVVLTGDGGDESFLGYPRYSQCDSSRWVERLPLSTRKLIAALPSRLPQWLQNTRLGRSLHYRLSSIAHNRSRRYERLIAYFSETDKLAGYGPLMRDHMLDSTLDLLEPYFLQSPTMLAGAAWADIHTYLPDDLLVKVDIATMAHSLEARSPLLDYRIMQWAASIPCSHKLRGGQTKYLLKKALEPYLPQDVIYRRKMGFGVPIERWLRTDLRDFAMEMVTSTRAVSRGIFEPDYGRRLMHEHCSGKAIHTSRLWAMIMLEQWFRMWIDPPRIPSQRPACSV